MHELIFHVSAAVFTYIDTPTVLHTHTHTHTQTYFLLRIYNLNPRLEKNVTTVLWLWC